MQFLGPTSAAAAPQSDITVTNNDVNPQDTTGFPLAAIYVATDSQGGGAVQLRKHLTGNTVPAGAAFDTLSAFLIADEVVAGADCLVVDTGAASASPDAELASHNTGSTDAAGGCALTAGPINTPP